MAWIGILVCLRLSLKLLQVDPGELQIRVQLQGVLVHAAGLVDAAQVPQIGSDIGVVDGVPRLDLDGPGKGLYGLSCCLSMKWQNPMILNTSWWGSGNPAALSSAAMASS
jgi:hypothetical protein